MKNYILLILTFCLLASCTTTDPLPPEPKMGDEWEYIYKTYAVNGAVLDSGSMVINTNSNQAYNPEYIWYADQHALVPSYPFGICRMNQDGLTFLVNTINRPFTVCIYKYPSFAGEINHINNEAAYIFNWNIRTLTTSGNIEVPYGAFNDVNIYELTYSSTQKDRVHLNDSVWIIKYERWDSTDANGYYKRHSYELVNYEAH